MSLEVCSSKSSSNAEERQGPVNSFNSKRPLMTITLSRFRRMQRPSQKAAAPNRDKLFKITRVRWKKAQCHSSKSMLSNRSGVPMSWITSQEQFPRVYPVVESAKRATAWLRYQVIIRMELDQCCLMRKASSNPSATCERLLVKTQTSFPLRQGHKLS